MKLWAWMKHLRKYKMRIEDVEAGLEESQMMGLQLIVLVTNSKKNKN